MITPTGQLRLVRRAFDARPPVILEPVSQAAAARLEADGEKSVPQITANAGISAWYREQLQCMARNMAADLLRKLKRTYPKARERLDLDVAMDDDPIVQLRKLLRQWGRKWQRRFDDMSAEIAESFAGRNSRYTDAQVRQRMRDAGFIVKFRPSERQVSAYRAVVAENVGLIKSIPAEFHKDVAGAVWRSVTKGGDMSTLSREIRRKYGVTARRAAFIARDQNAKAKAILEQQRRAEIGITEAVWVHSSAGKEPRPAHVRMDGKRFKIAEGMYDSTKGVQRKVQPGELPNCRCTSRAIIPDRLGKRAK